MPTQFKVKEAGSASEAGQIMKRMHDQGWEFIVWTKGFHIGKTAYCVWMLFKKTTGPA